MSDKNSVCNYDEHLGEEHPYPAALQQMTTKGLLMAGTIVVILIATLVLQKTHFASMIPFACAILLLAAYVVYTALHLRTEWENGDIICHVATCRSVRSRNWPRDSKEVIFVTGEDEEQEAHVFNLPDRKNKDLFPGFKYTIYVRAKDTTRLLAYQEIYVPADAKDTEEVKAELNSRDN